MLQADGKKEEPTETEPDTKREQKEMRKWYQTNTFKFVIILLVIALFLGIPAWLSLGNKTDRDLEKVKQLEKQVQKAKEMALPPTLSFLKEKISIVKSDTGYNAVLMFKPSKNRPPLGPTGFRAKVEDTSNAKIIDFDDIGSEHIRTLSKKISNDGKEALFTYDPGHFEYPKVRLKTSDACRVQISSSHIPEPFFVDIE